MRVVVELAILMFICILVPSFMLIEGQYKLENFPLEKTDLFSFNTKETKGSDEAFMYAQLKHCKYLKITGFISFAIMLIMVLLCILGVFKTIYPPSAVMIGTDIILIIIERALTGYNVRKMFR